MNSLKNLYVRAGVVTTGVLLSPLAFADAGTDAIAALEITAGTYISAAFSLAILIAVGFFGIRMMKKAARAAS